MFQLLQPRRFQSTPYVKREMNLARNKSDECIWENEDLMAKAKKHLSRKAWLFQILQSIHGHSERNHRRIGLRSQFKELACTWSPSSLGECLNLLQANTELLPVELQPRRWLFFGDSTMNRLFSTSNLRSALVEKPMASPPKDCFGTLPCKRISGRRCKLNDIYDLPYPEKWIHPNNFTFFAGPVLYGAANPYCTDCAGCNSFFLNCAPNQDTWGSFNECNISEKKFLHGGYIAIEFARYFEIQTPEYQIVQENIAVCIDRVLNTDYKLH